jgi:hypothetical protein
MRILLVTTKRISSTQTREFNKFYSVLNIGKQHLNKRIEQLGSSDLVLLNLNFTILHQPSKNEELKWINSQDLSGFKTVYIYSKPKYMKSFVKANLVLKTLPVTVGKTLEQVLAMSERLADGETSVSLTQEDLKAITEEVVKQEITADDIIDVMNKFKQLQRDYVELEAVVDKLRAETVKEIEPPIPTFHKRTDNIDSKLERPTLEAKHKPVKPVKSLKHINKGIELLSDGVIIDILKFNTRREQRDIRRQAMQWMRE